MLGDYSSVQSRPGPVGGGAPDMPSASRMAALTVFLPWALCAIVPPLYLCMCIHFNFLRIGLVVVLIVIYY